MQKNDTSKEKMPVHSAGEPGKPRKCRHCGRKLTNDELYCFFCELEISDDK